MPFILGQTDEGKKEHGSWVDYQGSQLLIAHGGNGVFQRELNRLQLPHKRRIEKGTLDIETSKSILCKAMAKGLLLGWKDVIDMDGNDISYSVEVAEQALYTDDELREFIQEYSTDQENFRRENADAIVKM